MLSSMVEYNSRYCCCQWCNIIEDNGVVNGGLDNNSKYWVLPMDLIMIIDTGVVVNGGIYQ